jgi:hypothetical protein
MTSRTRILPGRYAFLLLFAALFALLGFATGTRRHAYADGGGTPVSKKWRKYLSTRIPPLGARSKSAAQSAARGGAQAQGVRPLASGLSGTPVRVSKFPTPQSEIAMDVDPSDTSHIVIGSNEISLTNVPIDLFYSTDGGKSFNFSGQPNLTVGGVDYFFGSDPDVKWDTQGNVFSAYLAIDGFAATDAVAVARSTDNGATWPTVTQVAPPDLANFSDKEFIGVDTSPASPFKDNVYVAWTNFSATDGTIHFAVSSDHGDTFSAPITVSSTGALTQFADVATAADGTIAIVWWKGSIGPTGILPGALFFATSSDGGQTFTPEQKIPGTDNIDFKWFPFCAAERGIISEPVVRFDNSSGPFAGRMYVVWTAPTGSPDNGDIFVTSSDNLGTAWANIKRVNDDNTATSQFHGWLSVDPLDGRVGVSFYTCADDSANARAHMVLALSSDGGASFPNHSLANTPADESCYDPNRDQGNNYGEYSQSVALGGKNYITWTSTQNKGQEDVYFMLVDATSSTGTINVVTPNGGERLAVGQNTTLRWDTQGVGGNVMIELSRDSGATWETLFDVTPNDRFEPWTVTGPATDHARLRITSLLDPSITSTSIDDFTIVQPTLDIDSPVGGEEWPRGFIRRVSWHSSDLDGDILVELSRDGGSNWETIAADTANTGIFDWKVSGATTDQALVRVSSINIPSLQSESPDVFTIEDASITVTGPNGGETFSTGTTTTITWDSQAVSGQVAIDLSRNKGGSWTNIIKAVDVADGSADWTVTGPATNQALIRVRSIAMGVSDVSDDTFTIGVQGLALRTPNGGEKYAAGSIQNIRWTSAGVKGTVSLDLSRDSGKSWLSIASHVSNSGSYAWRVPAPLTTTARVRVCSDSVKSCMDASKADFSIGNQSGPPPASGSVTVLSPAGGETWKIGSLQSIQWSATGGISGGTVRIELSTNGGSTWQPLFGAVPNNGAQTWKVSGTTSNRCLVRITSNSDHTVTGTSKGVFTLTR